MEADQLDNAPLPQTCASPLGHDRVWERLEAQLNAGRLPGGILLHGPRGIGKASLAFAFARKVLARTGDEDPARIDHQISQGAHPNLFVLRRVARESGTGFYAEIRVSEVRAILHKLSQTAGRSGNRLLIVDSIDDCNANAANALLKTLEEPPAATQILLVSHRPGSLLPTIRSRCQALAMRPLTDEQVAAIIEGQKDTPGDLSSAVSFANGRPRRAFEFLQLGNDMLLKDLSTWLNDESTAGPVDVNYLVTGLSKKSSEAALGFARERVLDWISRQTRTTASLSPAPRNRLASLDQLWEKANSLFADMETYNLDKRAGMTVLFDEITRYRQQAS